MVVIVARDDRNVEDSDASDDDESPNWVGTNVLTTIIASIFVGCIALLAIFFIWRRRRWTGGEQSPKPVIVGKLQQFWRTRVPGARNRGYSRNLQQNQYQNQVHGQANGNHSRNNSNISITEFEMQRHPMTSIASISRTVNDDNNNNNNDRNGNNTSDSAVGVDRTASVRSVLTLPAYTPAARPTERIVGREGERGGVDVVLEYPETAEEEEARREEEMSSLYNIRTARRVEREAREEERQRRRHSRGQGQDHDRNQDTHLHGRSSLLDVSTATHNRSSIGTANDMSATLLANHQAAMLNRERRTSSVAYSSVGVAHHDGTRIRAGSDAGSAMAADADADGRNTADMPLLSSAASMGGAGTNGNGSRRGSSISFASVMSRGSANVSSATVGAGAGVGAGASIGGGAGTGIVTGGSANATILDPTRHNNGDRSNSNGSNGSGSGSANGVTTVLTPPVSSDDSIEDNNNGVATPLDDDTLNPPPGYDAPPHPPTYENPGSTPQPTTQT